jgi:hypothetical protein
MWPVDVTHKWDKAIDQTIASDEDPFFLTSTIINFFFLIIIKILAGIPTIFVGQVVNTKTKHLRPSVMLGGRIDF